MKKFLTAALCILLVIGILYARSGRWQTVRKHHLERQPACVVCGGKEKLEVHHIIPFHIRPELELEDTNLLTLCESERYGIDCHRSVGHRGNYRLKNTTVIEDARCLHEMIKRWKQEEMK